MEKNRPFDLLALGEVLLRLSPPGNERLAQGGSLQKQVGGSELNVVSGVSLLGLRTGIISKLPANDIGSYAKHKIRFCGVSDDYLIFDDDKNARMGLYFYESGSHPRKPRIVYDRTHSSAGKLDASEFPNSIFSSTRCFHTSGITLALSPHCRRCAVEMIKKFKQNGALISFDVNYRSNLWTGDEARRCMEEILPFVDYLFCSEDTARLTFKKSGTIFEMMKSFADEFSISVIASTQRTVHSPRIHTFGSVLYSASLQAFYREEPYENIEVVDRIGSGDAYISGVLYGLLTQPGNFLRALQLGNAAGAIKHTVPGDLPVSSRDEISATITSHTSASFQTEMDR